MNDYEILFSSALLGVVVGIFYGIWASKDGKSHPFL